MTVTTSKARFFWLSFADPDRPKGTQFLGAAIVQAHSPTRAPQVAWKQGCNPGGEVQMQDLTMGAEEAGIDNFDIPERFLNRLLTRDEAEEVDAWIGATYFDTTEVGA